MTITQPKQGTTFVSQANAVTLGRGLVTINENNPEKACYTGALRRAKRLDWVRFMAQFMVEGVILPQQTILTGVVEATGSDGLTIRLASHAPAQTGLEYGDLIAMPTYCILEHVPSDATVAAQTENSLNPAEAKTYRDDQGNERPLAELRNSFTPVEAKAGKFFTRDGQEATLWTKVDATTWLGAISGVNTYWNLNGTERSGNTNLDLVKEITEIA